MFEENRNEYFKYELYNLVGTDYIYKADITNYVLSASINTDFTRAIINTLNVEITNEYTDIDYLSNLIKPCYCMMVDSVEYKYSLGMYLMLSPNKSSDGNIVTRKIQCYDILFSLDQDKIDTSYTISLGTNVITAIKTILNTITWLKYSIDDNAETAPADMVYQTGTSKLSIINGLLKSINYNNLFIDGNGTLKATPWSSSINKVYDFIDNELSIYEAGIESNLDYTECFNKAIVISNQLVPDTDPIASTKTMEDVGLASHPLSYTNIGRYITKLFDSDATSQEYCDLRAERELYKNLEIEESINYSHAFVSSRLESGLSEPNDGYRFKNTLLDCDSEYKIESQNWNLDLGNSINTKLKKINIVV